MGHDDEGRHLESGGPSYRDKMERDDIWRVEVFSILICSGIISRSFKGQKFISVY